MSLYGHKRKLDQEKENEIRGLRNQRNLFLVISIVSTLLLALVFGLTSLSPIAQIQDEDNIDVDIDLGDGVEAHYLGDDYSEFINHTSYIEGLIHNNYYKINTTTFIYSNNYTGMHNFTFTVNFITNKSIDSNLYGENCIGVYNFEEDTYEYMGDQVIGNFSKTYSFTYEDDRFLNKNNQINTSIIIEFRVSNINSSFSFDLSLNSSMNFGDPAIVYPYEITNATLYKSSFYSNLTIDERDINTWYDYEEGSGSVINDKSGLSRDGTLQNIETADWVQGKIGDWAVNYDGVNEYTEGTNSSGNWERTDAFSVSLWFNFDYDITSGSHYVLAGKWDGSKGWNIATNAQERILFYRTNIYPTSNAAFIYTPQGGWNDGEWHHLVCTSDGTGTTGMFIYIDGEQEPTTTSANTLTATILNDAPFRVSGAGAWGEEFIGSIDEVMLINRDLDQFEVSDMWNNGLGIEEILSGLFVSGQQYIKSNQSYFSFDKNWDNSANISITIDFNTNLTSIDSSYFIHESIGLWNFDTSEFDYLDSETIQGDFYENYIFLNPDQEPYLNKSDSSITNIVVNISTSNILEDFEFNLNIHVCGCFAEQALLNNSILYEFNQSSYTFEHDISTNSTYYKEFRKENIYVYRFNSPFININLVSLNISYETSIPIDNFNTPTNIFIWSYDLDSWRSMTYTINNTGYAYYDIYPAYTHLSKLNTDYTDFIIRILASNLDNNFDIDLQIKIHGWLFD